MYDKHKIQEAYERILENEKEELNEGMFSSLIDDIKRSVSSKVSGKEHIRSMANHFFDVWIGVVEMMEKEDVDYKKLAKQMRKQMIDTQRVINSVTK